MSTRCRIAIKNNDGSYKSIYCHHDGYPSGVGHILKNYYTKKKKIGQLLALNDISSLGETLDYESTIDYNRFRDEDTHSEISETLEDLIILSKECWAEYLYIFENNDWTIKEI